MEDALSDYLQEIRDSEKAEGQTQIYTHGQRAWLSREEKLKTGIPLQDSTVAELRGIGDLIGIPFPL